MATKFSFYCFLDMLLLNPLQILIQRKYRYQILNTTNRDNDLLVTENWAQIEFVLIVKEENDQKGHKPYS